MNAAAGGGQEDGIAIRPGYQLTFYTDKGMPYPGALFYQLPLLLMGRHAPRRPPIDISGIILRVQLRLAIGKAVGTITAICAVLRHGVETALAPFVVFPRIGLFGLGLAPGEVVAVLFWGAGADVACRPQRAAGQTQVNVLMILFRHAHSTDRAPVVAEDPTATGHATRI